MNGSRNTRTATGRVRASCCCYLVSSLSDPLRRRWRRRSLRSDRSASIPSSFLCAVACSASMPGRPVPTSHEHEAGGWERGREGGSEGTPGVEESNREKGMAKGRREIWKSGWRERQRERERGASSPSSPSNYRERRDDREGQITHQSPALRVPGRHLMPL